MRINVAIAICLMLSLSTVISGSRYTVYGSSTNLTPTLVAPIFEFSREALEAYQWQGIEWVIFYGGFSKEASDYTHALGLKVLVYVTALKEPSSLYGYIDKTLAQYNGTHYIHPADMSTSEVWFSPFGPYIDQVLIPKIRNVIQEGADGVFLDTLILYPNADIGPYAYEVWQQKYSQMQFGSQEFRYQSTYDLLERVHNILKAEKQDAFLIVNNNNVFKQADRDKFASSIEKWQGVADGFVLEYIGIDPPDSPEEVIRYLVLPEREYFGVTKPMWLIYYTNQDDRFNYLTNKSKELNFGYWTYEKYLLQPNLIIFDGKPYHFSIQSNSTVSNLRFDLARRLINFSVSGADGTEGYANTIIPTSLLNGNLIVMVDNQEITPTQISQNSTHYIIRIDYHHSTQQITIGGANTIPEFSSSLFILTATTLLIVTLIKRKTRPHSLRVIVSHF